MTFEEFWKDKRIPPRMKRCGPGPVRRYVKQRNLDSDGLERVLASLAGYERHKADYADYCMLSTYISQERDMVEWEEMDEPSITAQDQSRKLHEARVNGYRKNGYWHPGWGDEPKLEVVK